MMGFLLAALLVLAEPVGGQGTIPDRPECDVCAARKGSMQKIHAARKAKACEAALAKGEALDGCSLLPPEPAPQN